jgi:hypothetical protein
LNHTSSVMSAVLQSPPHDAMYAISAPTVCTQPKPSCAHVALMVAPPVTGSWKARVTETPW